MSRFHLSWHPLVTISQWNDEPKEGSYSIFYSNLIPNQTVFDQTRLVRIAENITTTKEEFSTGVLDDFSCLRSLWVAAVSRGGRGDTSAPICSVVYSGGENIL